MANMIHALYFSPTGATAKITDTVAGSIQQVLDSTMIYGNMTTPGRRQQKFAIEKEDILVLGLPVYYGRIPAVVEETVKDILGDGALAVILAVYGNRAYDDALLEMQDILSGNGFKVIAAAGFIGEHSFSRQLAAGRPDTEDLAIAKEFGQKVAEKIKSAGSHSDIAEVTVAGNVPYTKRGAVPGLPKTGDQCTNCKKCAEACPTGAIDRENVRQVAAKDCIHCFACVKTCPEEAKFFDDETLLGIIEMLETNFAEPKKPELIL